MKYWTMSSVTLTLSRLITPCITPMQKLLIKKFSFCQTFICIQTGQTAEKKTANVHSAYLHIHFIFQCPPLAQWPFEQLLDLFTFRSHHFTTTNFSKFQFPNLFWLSYPYIKRLLTWTNKLLLNGTPFFCYVGGSNRINTRFT